jgi:PleD family two-component response regulator
MTGFELARQVKSLRPDIPIIMCTGFDDKTDVAMAKEIGIQEFVMKPLNKSKLAKTIRKVLDNKKT